jgi:hypothetical protein
VKAQGKRKKRDMKKLQQFHPFSLMDLALKPQYQFLSQHLIAQTKFQNPNKLNGPAYSGDMYSARK